MVALARTTTSISCWTPFTISETATSFPSIRTVPDTMPSSVAEQAPTQSGMVCGKQRRRLMTKAGKLRSPFPSPVSALILTTTPGVSTSLVIFGASRNVDDGRGPDPKSVLATPLKPGTSQDCPGSDKASVSNSPLTLSDVIAREKAIPIG